ncbi:hypothetical protein [Pseudomonas sp. TCU-HL1]|uniref:hypothetical protein n=1 Tax=Pseudomonas sp. TCU-HL1 TaxID=1856685 RepID=UPI00083D8453|nr:hypothetical protein [Pseudomonas sp. TCU-HL1]AOE85158.1 hypothetical protein THL1_2610 [Pseudomonas sp. TCU-HL1]
MARIIPFRPAPAAPKRPAGLRGWIRRLRNSIDWLVYQLIRMPSRRARGAGSEAREPKDAKARDWR